MEIKDWSFIIVFNFFLEIKIVIVKREYFFKGFGKILIRYLS